MLVVIEERQVNVHISVTFVTCQSRNTGERPYTCTKIYSRNIKPEEVCNDLETDRAQLKQPSNVSELTTCNLSGHQHFTTGRTS